MPIPWRLDFAEDLESGRHFFRRVTAAGDTGTRTTVVVVGQQFVLLADPAGTRAAFVFAIHVHEGTRVDPCSRPSEQRRGFSVLFSYTPLNMCGIRVTY